MPSHKRSYTMSKPSLVGRCDDKEHTLWQTELGTMTLFVSCSCEQF